VDFWDKHAAWVCPFKFLNQWTNLCKLFGIREPPQHTLPNSHSSYILEGPLQLELRIHMYVQETPIEIQTPACWNAIGPARYHPILLHLCLFAVSFLEGKIWCLFKNFIEIAFTSVNLHKSKSA